MGWSLQKIRLLAVAVALLTAGLLGIARADDIKSNSLILSAAIASTNNLGSVGVVRLTGAPKVELADATLSADEIIVWIQQPAELGSINRAVEFVLLGNATIRQQSITRTARELYVKSQIRGEIQIRADRRDGRDFLSDEDYLQARQLRPVEPAVGPDKANLAPGTLKSNWSNQRSSAPIARTTDSPPVVIRRQVEIKGGRLERIVTADRQLAAVATGGVLIIERDDKNNLIEFQSESAVLFSNVTEEATTQKTTGDFQSALRDNISSIYLEGDVQVIFTPVDARRGEQRLRGDRVFYDVQTDRAVLTQAIIHTLDPRKQIPLFVRADTIRQLSQNDYVAEYGSLTTSAFTTPSYALNSHKIYVHREDSGDPNVGWRTNYTAEFVSFALWDWPIGWLPIATGSVSDKGDLIRGMTISKNNIFGLGTGIELGAFETVGATRPPDLDISYKLANYDKRGPALGLNGKYDGGFIDDVKAKPWNFSGDFEGILVSDRGKDHLGATRNDLEPPDNLRGSFQWQHQHFFGDDYQLQLRAGYSSDPNFLEQWSEKKFDTSLPHDLSIYLKRQRNTEAYTFFSNYQTQNFVTTSENLAEQTEVAHLPSIGYHRLGDSPNDTFTFFSDNSIDSLKFQKSSYPLSFSGFNGNVTPGLPSFAETGLTDKTVYRGDTRQEIDLPFSTGHFKWVPYVFGRYTAYSRSPVGDDEYRTYVGTGLRVSTAFWAVDDSFANDFLDLHRLRHVVEPSVDVYASAENKDPNRLYSFDDQTDQINDIQAISLGLRQQWQTKRGGAGRWRNVDFFTLNTTANFFGNKPDEAQLQPENFRGVFYQSLPEASIPRDSINADGVWRITDSTSIVGDIQHNLDRRQIATAALGLAAHHWDQVSFFVGSRYIEELRTNITSVSLDYAINNKYTLNYSQGFDFAQRKGVSYALGLTRRFDRFAFITQIHYDQAQDNTGFAIGIIPFGLAKGIGVSSDRLENR